ncbi:hypothetical protein [Bacteroides sp. UBA939]|uniref:hypothetical protein n=1 Tax=Bacteroides sp. UBA939 TaxID=1946092 RepID=UPI0025BCF109|nr:hypothetical protein [Bacteroides sp. UBA939]
MINKAIKMIHEHDFFWIYADCEASAREASRRHMVTFVEFINAIDANTRKALKDLWLARHEWAKKNMFEINKEALNVYETKEAETLASLTALTYTIAA